MELISFTKEFLKVNKNGILISIVMLSFGSLMIYAKQHPNDLSITTFLLYLPLSWMALMVMGFMMALFLYGEKD